MVLGNRPGLMVLSTWESGGRIALTEKASLSTSMETCTMVFGQTTKQIALWCTNMLMERCTKENGRTICSTEEVLRRGQTKVATMGTTSSGASMVSEATAGTMEASTRATGVKTKSVESEFTHGSTADATKANGLITIWRGWEYTFGTTAACIKANIRMIKSTGSAFIHGRMVAVMKASGIRASSMDWVPTSCLKTAS